MKKIKDKIKIKLTKFKKEVKDLKNKISKVGKTKLFWCESIIIVSFFMFTITNFLLNFFVGIYLLSLSLLGIALFSWKYL
ncbi:hypothetical protein PMY12_14800 [Clostridium tertium]|uniref:hypothetical protein n=1 Tax=Clostridium tertium TaxID=1559 RepID=UPI00232F4637|nr:hypothetical protein [Clostridium tertium]MDB1931681.1 hypothetical protein [Clostridium tertium]MDB1938273.1 hypothetical protein [Clostridium tertium]MDI9216050.1 hypothetical protein [Clostridium tertium]